jgi:hypothetical protein
MPGVVFGAPDEQREVQVAERAGDGSART